MYVLEWCRYKSIDIVETEIIWLMNEGGTSTER
jgi:hypothetical protein